MARNIDDLADMMVYGTGEDEYDDDDNMIVYGTGEDEYGDEEMYDIDEGGVYSGGVLYGGAVSGGGTREQWVDHVKGYAAHHGISYKEALSKAGPSYRKAVGYSKGYKPKPKPKYDRRPGKAFGWEGCIAAKRSKAKKAGKKAPGLKTISKSYCPINKKCYKNASEKRKDCKKSGSKTTKRKPAGSKTSKKNMRSAKMLPKRLTMAVAKKLTKAQLVKMYNMK